MRGLTFLLVVFVPLSTLAAQQPSLLEPGSRVRVTAPECGLDQQAGTLQPSRGDTLVLGYGFDNFPCLRSNVTRLDVHRGRKKWVLEGAGLGLLGGGLLGAGIGYASTSNGCIEDCGLVRRVFAGLGASGGVVIGTVIGALTKTDRWEEVPLDRLRVSFAPQRGGRFGLGLTVSF